MIKTPMPTFTAAYPMPKQINWTLIIGVLIVIALGVFIYCYTREDGK